MQNTSDHTGCPLTSLFRIRESHPHLRVGQIIRNVVSPQELFNITDQELEHRLNSLLTTLNR